jgi:hypothetical protein
MERFLGGPAEEGGSGARSRSGGGGLSARVVRVMAIAGVAAVALVVGGAWLAWKQPTYGPPPGDEIAILLELAGVFPDKYLIMWRQHGVLRAGDPQARSEPELLGGALMLHNLTTAATRSEGDIYVEVAYRYFGSDHQIDEDEPQPACRCDTLDRVSMSCVGRLAFENYEFTLEVAYNNAACTNPVDPQRVKEFQRAMQTADRLIGLYLEPLRRKPRWL